jgi:hypothetical protein
MCAQSSTTKRAFPPKGHGSTVLTSELRQTGIRKASPDYLESLRAA